jgi:mono/diheme cytochrome c family protein
MSLRWIIGGVAFGAVALVVAACAGSSGEDGLGSFTGTDDATRYSQACASCHGDDLGGTDQGPPFLDAVYRSGHHADAAFLLAVRRGARSHHWNFGDMPPVEGVSDQQVQVIVEFVRSPQAEAGIE